MDKKKINYKGKNILPLNSKRAEKVSTIKKNITNGTYSVKSHELAEKMVQKLKEKIFYAIERT